MPSLATLNARLLNAGDRALVIEFGECIDPETFARVNDFDQHVQQLHASGELPGFCESVPTFRSLAIVFDPRVVTRATLVERLFRDDESLQAPACGAVSRSWQLPVSYGPPYGLDLDSVARATGLSSTEVCELHHNTSYRVYMLGFMPGYAFMGDLPAALRLPRRAEPRVRIPPGTLAIALQLTGIYPWQSPGGWHLIGRCPVPLFDAYATPPTLLQPGDQVTFRAVTARELQCLESDLDAGRAQPTDFSLSSESE